MTTPSVLVPDLDKLEYEIGSYTDWTSVPKTEIFKAARAYLKQQAMITIAKEDNALTVADYEKCMADHRRMVRELDVLLNGDGAAKQASLCDIVGQLRDEKSIVPKPVTVKRWVNYYDTGSVYFYNDRTKADRDYNSGRIACKEIEITFTPGEGL